MASKKILVTGANGQLGRELRELTSQYPLFEFVFADRAELSIENENRVDEYFNNLRPFACINCAAYTAVDKAEIEKEKAYRVNAQAVGNLASACFRNETLFVHISTDYVFDGNSSTPYSEADETNPVNHYGLTKLRGEELALQSNPSTIIIRTSWVYSEFGNNFVKTMMRLMKEKESINVVDDQVGSPTYAADLANAILTIVVTVQKESRIKQGIYHYSNEGTISWYEFAEAIKDLIGSNCRVNPIHTSQYPTPARRPRYSLLDKSKIKSTFYLQIPHWKDSLAKCIDRLK